MAKTESQPKKTSPVVWVAIIGLSVLAYVSTTPSAPAPVVKHKKPLKKVSSSLDAFTDADYKAHFNKLNEPIRNAFKPLIVRNGIGGGGLNPFKVADGSIPPSFTGGEAGWTYSGSAALNGSVRALIENTSTGESVLVRPGDRWKSSTLGPISSTAITLVGADGEATTVAIANPDAGDLSPSGGTPARGTTGISGPIGDISIRPVAARNSNINAQ